MLNPKVELLNINYSLSYEKCGNLTYLQRFNFFKLIDIDVNENFQRHPSDNRFVTVQRIDSEMVVPRIATEIADCIAPDQSQEFDSSKTGLHDGIEYAVSELCLNVVQHSRSTGFVTAQYYETTDFVRIAIADTGIGITESFKRLDSPHCKLISNDLDAIKIALKPNISSRSHIFNAWSGERENRGVGLTILHDLCKNLDGDFILSSGKGFYSLRNNTEYFCNTNTLFNGTFCAINLKRQRLNNFNNELKILLDKDTNTDSDADLIKDLFS